MKLKTLSGIFLFLISAFIFNGCNKDNVTNQNDLTDDQFVQSVVSGGYDNNTGNEDNLTSMERDDLDNGGAINDNDGGGFDNPMDSLKRWGRTIRNVNLEFQIENSGDTLKTVHVTRTISGHYRIIGYLNGQTDSVNKPYTEVFYRTVAFRRVARSEHPRLNWRVYQISNLDGGTTQPQVGSSQVQITKIEIYKNNALAYTLTGPDFRNIMYTTMLFGGQGIPSFSRNDQIKVNVYTTSQQSAIDYVAYHWARNTFGFHRVPFNLVSQSGSGPFERVYSKTFNIYNAHRLGVFNGFLNASTRESLYDDDVSKFASDEVGIPYKIVN